MKHAANALWGLTSGSPGSANWKHVEQNLATITRAGAVPLLIDMLSSNSRGEVGPEHLGYAVATLNNMAIDPAARAAISEAKGAEVMVTHTANMQNNPWLLTQANEFLQKLGVNPLSAAPAKLNMEPLAAHAEDRRKSVVGKPSARLGTSARPQFKVHAGSAR
jgi:hypothetical protein